MQSGVNKILPWSWAFIWFMMPISLKLSMLSVWIFTVLVVISNIVQCPRIMRKQWLVVILPSLLFLWYLISWLYSSPELSAHKEIVSKSALIMLPLMLLLSQNIKGVNLSWAMRGLILAIILSGFHLIIRAMMIAFTGSGYEEWTYHGFTAPYNIGAIYYSWYLSIALLYLMFGNIDELIKKYRDTLIIFILLLLLAAASKLFILIMLPVAILYYIFILRYRTGRLKWLLPVILILVVVAGTLPFLNRFQEVSDFDISVVNKDKYSYDTPLNGLTLRLIQWRLGFEILDDENAYLMGTGPGNGQKFLDMKYADYGLYTGNVELDDTGYLGYNFHNQYVETLIETGWPGLILLILLLVGATFIYKKLLIFPKAVLLITILFLLTESVLERQAGITVFSMLMSFAPADENNLEQTKQ